MKSSPDSDDGTQVDFQPHTLNPFAYNPAPEEQKAMAEIIVRLKPLGVGYSDFALKNTSSIRYCGASPEIGAVYFKDAKGKDKNFNYPSHVINESYNNHALFDKIMGKHIANFLAGYNVNFMAYGQTGSGKTFTMIGPRGGFDHPASESSIPSTWGLFPRFLHAMYMVIKDDKSKVLTISVNQNSFRYPEDLLTRKPIRFDTPTNDYTGQQELQLTSFEQIIQVCKVIEKVRASRATKMNIESSRIHCFMNIKLYQCSASKMVRMSQFRFIDLCGSERADIVSNHDKMAQLESVANNFNLLLLTQVMQHTVRLPRVTQPGAEPPASTYWKQNPLTRILKESFNSMAFTAFVLCLSQAEQNTGESHYTMEFGKFPSKLVSYVIKPKAKKLSALISKTEEELKINQQKVQELARAPRQDPSHFIYRNQRIGNCEDLLKIYRQFE